MFKKLQNLPSIVWVILMPLGIIALVGGIILLFTAIATVEGFASIVFIIIGLIIAFAGSDVKVPTKKMQQTGSGFAVAAGIVFFALMGMAIDQTGNVIYNKPLEVFYCPSGSYLSREAIISNPLPGRTDINQEFNCVQNKKVVSSIDIGSIILVRFVEYVILGYFFIGLGKVISYLKRNWAKSDNLIQE